MLNIWNASSSFAVNDKRKINESEKKSYSEDKCTIEYEDNIPNYINESSDSDNVKK